MTSTGSVGSRDHIFISYRRDDARGASGRLYDWLRIGFGRNYVFRDVHSIGVGKWREKIDQALASSAVCVAVIGPRWANADNLRRLRDGSDMVRHELLSALADDAVILVPTLVEGTGVPKTGKLPAELQPLFDNWNALSVTEAGWEDDIRRLINEIADATTWSVSPDLDALLCDASAAQSRMIELELQRDLQAGQIDALQRSIGDLTTKLAEATDSERAELGSAFVALAKGDTLVAEEAFQREFEERRLAREQETYSMAEAARNVANLALMHDVRKAVSYYREALALVPEDPENSRLLSYALISLGDLGSAEAAMEKSFDAAMAQGNMFGEMASRGGLGDIAMMKGNLADAKEAFEASLAVAEQLAESDPSNTVWHNLLVSYQRLGGVAKAQGRLDDAVHAYEASLAIAEQLAEIDPSTTEWLSDQRVSENVLGDLAVTQGRLTEAAWAYEDALAIAEWLAESNPSNTVWQSDLANSYINVGSFAVTQGRLTEAVQAFEKALVITKGLAENDPSNTVWQSDLASSYLSLGDVAVAQGQLDDAVRAYEDTLAITKELAENDPNNSEWQHDLWIRYLRLADLADLQKNPDEALAYWKDAFKVLSDIKHRGLHLSPEYEQSLDILQQRVGIVEQ